MRTEDAPKPEEVEEVTEPMVHEDAMEPMGIKEVTEPTVPKGRKDEVASGSPFFLRHILPSPRARCGSATLGGSSSARRGGLPLVIGPEVFDMASEVLQDLCDIYQMQ